MAAEPVVVTNIKSITQGQDQPGIFRFLDADGNSIFYINRDDELVEVGYAGYAGYTLKTWKGITTWFINFITNTSNTLGEWWGIVAKLSGRSGSYAFRVQDDTNTDVWTARDDGHCEFKPTADTTNNLKAGVMHYDSATNKFKFYNGSSWETITSA